MSYLANSEVNSPRPCVIWRSVSAKSPSSASGASAWSSVMPPPTEFMPRTEPRRFESTLMTSPCLSSGRSIFRLSTGSSRYGWASFMQSLNAIEAAVLNAISELSTGW